MMSKQNAEEDYIKTPISVLAYIRELEDDAIAEEINLAKRRKQMDLSNHIAIDKGVLQLMFNVLERQGKHEIVEEAKATCKAIL